MTTRALSDYVYGSRLRVGFYGEVFRAHRRDNGHEARILHVDPALAARPDFVAALGRHCADLQGLPAHPHVITTIAAGRRNEDGVIAVITEPVAGAIALDTLRSGRRQKVPIEIAIAVVRAVVAGLAHAHRLEIIHGAVHPRSVVIDIDGRVVLGDFAPARALLAPYAGDSDGDDNVLRAGLHGYLAPELVLGDPASAASDVFAAGALAFDLLAGAPPPGQLPAPPAITRAVTGALHTDSRARYAEAAAFETALAEAIASDRIAQPSPRDIANFVVAASSSSDADLDADTSDFVSSLTGASVSSSGIRDLARIPAVPARARRQSSLPLPPRPPTRPGDPHARTPTPLVSRDPDHGTGEPPAIAARIDDVLTSLESELSPPPPVRHVPAPAEPKIQLRKRRLGLVAWLAVTAAFLLAGAAGIYVIAHRDDGRLGDLNVTMQRIINELAALAPRPGTLVIDSKPQEAAVWLYLGETPARSFAVSAGVPHQVRVEKAGYQSVDVTLGKRDWKPDGEDLLAEAAVTLEATDHPRALSPAPAPPPLSSAGHTGSGPLIVTSQPPGASVWLFIGSTPACQITGLSADRPYTVRVEKRGFKAQSVTVSQWPPAPKAGIPTLHQTISLRR